MNIYPKFLVIMLLSTLTMAAQNTIGTTALPFSSPKVPESRYETFVSKELIAYVDSHFPTYPTPAKRAVTGLSMGGHGAMWLAIRHKDVFGAEA